MVQLSPDDVETRKGFSLGIRVSFHGATSGQAIAISVFLQESLVSLCVLTGASVVQQDTVEGI